MREYLREVAAFVTLPSGGAQTVRTLHRSTQPRMVPRKITRSWEPFAGSESGLKKNTLWRATFSRELRIPRCAPRRGPMLGSSRPRSRPPDRPPIQVTRNRRSRPTVPLTLRLCQASRRRHTTFDPQVTPPQGKQGATITFFRSLKFVGCLDGVLLLCPTCATFLEEGGAT